MAKEIYIDGNGNEQLVSGTINTGKLLPMSSTDPDKVADRIMDLENTACSVVKGANMPTGFPLPIVNRYGKVVTVNFAVQIPSGTYLNTDVLWVLTPKPVSIVRVILTTGTIDLMNVTTDGNVKFNSNKTFNSDAWVIGSFTYLTS